MSKELDLIDGAIRSAQAELKNLSPNSLGDNDVTAVAEKGVKLREKIAVLQRERKKELRNISEQKKLDKEKQRKEFLNSVKSATEKKLKLFSELNTDIESCLDNLLLKVKLRHELFDEEYVNDFNSNSKIFLSEIERTHLKDSISYVSASAETMATDIGSAFMKSAIKHGYHEDACLQEFLREFLRISRYQNSLSLPQSSISEVCDEILKTS